MDPLVTVIIPNYNKSTYLQQCIDSVIRQTYRPIEILVVDDASKDCSVEILMELQRKYSMLKVIQLKENGGVSHARNVGISQACGSIVTMLDSDDFYINSKKIENEVHALQQTGTNLAFAYSKTVFVDENGKRMDVPVISNEKYLTGNIFESLIKCKGLSIVPRDYCFGKEIVKAHSLSYNEQMNFFEDTDFLMQIAAKNVGVCTYEEGTGYRQNTNGLSNKSEKVQYRKRWDISWRYLNKISNPTKKIGLVLYLALYRVRFETKLVLKSNYIVHCVRKIMRTIE